MWFVVENLILNQNRSVHVCVCVCARTHDEAQLLVVTCVHGLALLHAAAVVGLALHVEGDPPQLEDDVTLGLQGTQYRRLKVKGCPKYLYYCCAHKQIQLVGPTPPSPRPPPPPSPGPGDPSWSSCGPPTG